MRAFVKEDAGAFKPALTVAYKKGKMPRIVLSKPLGDASDPEATESVRIDTWEKHHITEFLKERLA